MPIVNLEASVTITNRTRVDTSSDRRELLARRTIIGRVCEFFVNGEHVVDAAITPEEEFNSEILRYAHVSLLTGQPEGNKATLLVDATKEPVEVWTYGMRLEEFLRRAVDLIEQGTIDPSLVMDGDPIPKMRTIK